MELTKGGQEKKQRSRVPAACLRVGDGEVEVEDEAAAGVGRVLRPRYQRPPQVHVCLGHAHEHGAALAAGIEGQQSSS